MRSIVLHKLVLSLFKRRIHLYIPFLTVQGRKYRPGQYNVAPADLAYKSDILYPFSSAFTAPYPPMSYP